MAYRTFSTHPLVVRRAEVRRVVDVSPRMRRVTVGGAELGAFTRGGWQHPAFHAPGFDDHVKLVFASDGDVPAAAPVQTEHGIEWRPSATRQARDYTPRAVRQGPGGTEVDLDFVLHGHGPAASWATSATDGDELWFVGPKSSTRLPDGVQRVVLLGDETALPAIGRFLDERPADAPVTIAVLIGHDEARQELTLREQDTIRWIVGDPTDPGLLVAAARRACDLDRDGLYVWAAGESRALLPVRRFLTRELGLPKTHVNVTGYWHHAAVPASERSARRDNAPSGAPRAVPETLADGRHVASPLPWLVVRAALQLDVVDVVADTSGIPAPVLAARCRISLRDLDLLLPTLLSHGVLAGDAAALRLGPLGDDLIDDEHARERFDGLDAETMLALDVLGPAMRAGRSPWAQRHGETLDAWSAGDPERYAELIEGAESLTYLLDGLVADPVWQDVRRVALTGPGAALLVGALTDHARTPDLEVWESPAGIAALRDEVERPASVTWSVLEAPSDDRSGHPDIDLAVVAMGLAHRTDPEASLLLRTLGERAGRAVVIESSRPDGLSPRAAEAALLGYAVAGTPLRSSGAIAALAAVAGWRVTRVAALGWGVEATFLDRVGAGGNGIPVDGGPAGVAPSS